MVPGQTEDGRHIGPRAEVPAVRLLNPFHFLHREECLANAPRRTFPHAGVTQTAPTQSSNIWRMENLRKSVETKRLIYGDCVINEHDPESWSWLAKQSRSPQIKLWLSAPAGPPSLCFLCRAGLNLGRMTRPWLAAARPGLSGDFITALMVLLKSCRSDICYWSN